MTNIEGMYASEDIEEGRVILTEEEMPDCELPRSKQPNCGVAEVEEGLYGLVSLREIRMGEWFSVAVSDDEDDDDDDGEGGWEEGEGGEEGDWEEGEGGEEGDWEGDEEEEGEEE